jgi:hypothetical protein
MRCHGRPADEQIRGDLRIGQGQAAGDPERQINLLCASQAMAATVLVGIPNGGSGAAAPAPAQSRFVTFRRHWAAEAGRSRGLPKESSY